MTSEVSFKTSLHQLFYLDIPVICRASLYDM